MKKKLILLLIVVFAGISPILAKDIRVVVFKVEQMMCQNCEKKVRDNMKFEKGLKKIDTDVDEKRVTITYDADKTNVEKIKAGFKKFNYEAVVVENPKKEDTAK